MSPDSATLSLRAGLAKFGQVSLGLSTAVSSPNSQPAPKVGYMSNGCHPEVWTGLPEAPCGARTPQTQHYIDCRFCSNAVARATYVDCRRLSVDRTSKASDGVGHSEEKGETKGNKEA